MTAADFIVLTPLMIISGMAVVIMLIAAFIRSHVLTAILASAACAAALVSLFFISPRLPYIFRPLFIFDTHAVFYMGLIFAASFAVIWISYGYFRNQRDPLPEGKRIRGIRAPRLQAYIVYARRSIVVPVGGEERNEELYVLLLCATTGAAVLTVSRHFISFFLGLEVLTVPLYVLISYLRSREQCIEAGVKYLILAAASSAFLLFGMALLYAESGSMEFSVIGDRIGCDGAHLPVILAGTALLTVGIGFKLAVVPFHMWTPDVYEGAPAPVTAFIATVSKGAVFALLLRLSPMMDMVSSGVVISIFSGIAVASMLAGNLLALLQNNVKRILAYSSIAHLGYLLVAYAAGGGLAHEAVAFYLAAYFITTLGAFGIVALLSDGPRDAELLDDYRGLFWRRPLVSLCFTAMMLSLAGIPLTAGFVGKFYIIAAGVKSSLWLLVFMLVLGSVIGLYYYLRIIVAMYTRVEAPVETAMRPALPPSFSLAGALVLAVLTLLLVWYGVYPAGLMEIVGKLITGAL